MSKFNNININLSLVSDGLKVTITDDDTGDLLATDTLTDREQLRQFGEDILKRFPAPELEKHADGFKPKEGSNYYDSI